MKLETKNEILRNCPKNSKSKSQKCGNIGKFAGKFRGKGGKLFLLTETVHISSTIWN